ncbi:phage portal protein [Actinocorallia sp. API 0066]|uniref:phage portal protein n=1 Tax=Actinocorallia sp. API 0066 TaxID=2896846 RepID=UPI001E4706FA|nr:phage portal protein [Actinocorallia sp. API 0066]MCD0450776.1 phage portal protein [Actinocorallia sp. API 0066]
MLSSDEAAARARELLEFRRAEARRLDRIHEYVRTDPNWRPPWLSASAPHEVRRLAEVSRVNMLAFVVSARVQNLYVDGYRTPRSADDAPVWATWQANAFDARQIGVHRAAMTYGASYVTVLPGDPVPVMRGVSPRDMTAMYGDDDDWPELALQKRRSSWRLIDAEAVCTLLREGDTFRTVGVELHGATLHGVPVCPVVRYRETDDLDDPVVGLAEPHMDLQDQINITSFGLHVAQHYGAHRQRYILGWLGESEEQRLKASASKLWTFDDPDVKVGEFGQTDLGGYIESREASLRHLATVSQTPAHELLGQLVNLSAEALAAAEAGQRRAVAENQTVIGEAHEQALALAGAYQGLAPDPSAAVRWRDTEARSLGLVVDALGKMAQMLGIPPQALWERVPGVSDDDLERWRTLAAEGDAFARLQATIERQMNPVPGGTDG